MFSFSQFTHDIKYLDMFKVWGEKLKALKNCKISFPTKNGPMIKKLKFYFIIQIHTLDTFAWK